MENVSVQDIIVATGGVLLSGNGGTMLNKIRLDSRQVESGDLFVPIIGEKVDAHKFLGQVAAKGAGAVLTSEHREKTAEMDETSCAWIAVDDTKKALQDVGRHLRKRLTLPIVGVTGSVGKTTTREMIAAALSARFHVYKTPGNSNSQVGVPITVSEITKEDEIGVLELGMSEPGELTVIAQIAKPDVAVITNIGITHIEQLGSRDNIYKEKMTIQDGLSDGGVLVLNGDDDMLQKTTGKTGVKTVYYGTGVNCDYRAVALVLTDGKAEFTAVHDGETHREAGVGHQGDDPGLPAPRGGQGAGVGHHPLLHEVGQVAGHGGHAQAQLPGHVLLGHGSGALVDELVDPPPVVLPQGGGCHGFLHGPMPSFYKSTFYY